MNQLNKMDFTSSFLSMHLCFYFEFDQMKLMIFYSPSTLDSACEMVLLNLNFMRALWCWIIRE